MKTVIFSAPQGWGKTLKAQDLQREFGCAKVVDDWWPGQTVTPGALHLTHAQPHELPESSHKHQVVVRGH